MSGDEVVMSSFAIVLDVIMPSRASRRLDRASNGRDKCGISSMIVFICVLLPCLRKTTRSRQLLASNHCGDLSLDREQDPSGGGGETEAFFPFKFKRTHFSFDAKFGQVKVAFAPTAAVSSVWFKAKRGCPVSASQIFRTILLGKFKHDIGHQRPLRHYKSRRRLPSRMEVMTVE